MVQGIEVVNTNESSLVMQKPFNLDSNPENVPLVENFSESHSSNALNACDSSSSSAIHENNRGKVDDEVREETQQISEDDPCERKSSTCDVPGAGLRETYTSSSEGGSSASNFNDEKPENSNSGLFSISSEPNNYSEEENRNHGNSLQS